MQNHFLLFAILLLSLSAIVCGEPKPVLHMRNHRPVVVATEFEDTPQQNETLPDEPFVPSTPPPAVKLAASKMQCVVEKSPKWLLVCHDVVLDDIYFEQDTDCTVVDGIRECSTLL